MKFSLLFILFSLSYCTTFSQVATIDVKLSKRTAFNSELFMTTMITTTDDNNVYCFFPKARNPTHYRLEIMDSNLKKVKSVESINLGYRGGLRNLFVKEEVVYKSSIFKTGINKHKFVLHKTTLENPTETDYCLLEFHREDLLASSQDGDNYYVVSLTDKNELKIYTIDLETLKSTTKTFQLGAGIYNKIFESINNAVDIVQIDKGGYSDLQNASCKSKSYFQNGKYILTVQSETKDIIQSVDLQSDKLSGVEIKGILGERSSVLVGDKYYVSEFRKKEITLKAFDINTGKLLKEAFRLKKDETGFRSTDVYENGEKRNVESFLKLQKSARKQVSSFGLMAETVGTNTVLILGLPIYTYHVDSYIAGDGKTTVGLVNNDKSDYKHERLKPMYEKQVVFESWLDKDGNSVSYEADATLKASYHKIYEVIQKYNLDKHFSHLTVFKINDVWYLGCYNQKEKQYSIFEI